MTPSEISALRQRIQTGVGAGRVKQIVLANGAGIDPSQLSRFLKGASGIADAQLALLQTTFDESVEAPDPLLPEYAVHLARLLRDNKLILFAGAGLSKQCPPLLPGEKGFPMWQELVDLVAAQFDADQVNADEFRSTPTLFFDYVHSLQDGEAKLKAALRGALDSSRISPAAAHQVLARLPWAEVWTTNYDDMLERVLAAKLVNGNNDHELIAHYKRSKTPFVLHLHGTVNDPHTLGKRSYELWEQNSPKLIAHLRSMLLDGHTALFVGYGMGDPNLDAVFGWLRNVTDNKLRLYGLLHNVPRGVLSAYERSINLHAVSLSSNAEYVAAFRQIEHEYRVLMGELARGAVDVTNASIVADADAATDTYERTQLATAMRRRWDDSGVAGLYLTDAKYRADDLGVDHVFVEPSVATWVVLQGETVWSDSDGGIDVWLDEAGKEVVWDEGNDMLVRMRRPTRQITKPLAEPAITSLLQQRLVVLLGDPGSGKSLLLRHIARAAAEAWQTDSSTQPSPLPIYLRLNAWESQQSAHATDVALLNVVRDELLSYADVPREQIQQWTASDRPMLWLLDGLDEVRSQGARDGVREAVATLARARPQDSFIVSARPSGYRTRFDGQWRELELQPLNDAQQAAVLERWRDITATRDNLTLDVPGLSKDLKASRALSDLRGNPLMLTLAILFYRIKRRLPRDRWEYYEIVDTNLRDQLARSRALSDQPVESARRAWGDILGRIALYGMQSGLGESGQGKVRFSRDEIENIVVDYNREQEFSIREAMAEADRFLRAADDLLGVIVAFAPDEYGFLHLTFQEYHAARRLLQMNSGREADDRARLMANAWDHPDWKELWQLFVIGAADTGRSDLFEWMCNAAEENGWVGVDEHLPRRQLQQLAWAGLAGARVFSTEAWRRNEQWVLAQLSAEIWLWPSSFISVLESWSWPLSSTVRDALLSLVRRENINRGNCDAAVRALTASTSEPLVQNVLIDILRDTSEHPSLRDDVAEVLGAAVAEPQVRIALMDVLLDVATPTMARGGVANALARIVRETDVQDALIKALVLDSQLGHHPRGVCVALSPVSDHSTVQDALARIVIDKDAPDKARQYAAMVLGNTKKDANTHHLLLNALQDKSTPELVRVSAINAFWRNVNVASVTNALVEALLDNQEPESVRESAASVLSSNADEVEVKNALIQIAVNSVVPHSVRGRAALALQPVAQEAKVADTLINTLLDGDAPPSVRQFAINALDKVSYNSRVRSAFLATLLSASATDELRVFATRALSASAEEESVQVALVNALLGAESSQGMRAAAADALRAVVDRTAVGEALITVLRDKALPEWPRRSAAEALSTVAREGTPAQEALIAVLLDDTDWEGARALAARALTAFASQARVQIALIKVLHAENTPDQSRGAAAEALIAVAGETAVKNALLNVLRGKKAAGAILYATQALSGIAWKARLADASGTASTTGRISTHC